MSFFHTSASCIARTRADKTPAFREHRVGDEVEAERSSSHDPAPTQHRAVLHFVKECLPVLFGASSVPIVLKVIDEDAFDGQSVDGVRRLYRDCVIEVTTAGLTDSEIVRLRGITRSLCRQLSANDLQEDGLPELVPSGFISDRLKGSFSPEPDSIGKALLPLIGRAIANSFSLHVPGLASLPMSGKFVSAPESTEPAKEQVLKGRVGSGSFLVKNKKELVLLVNAPIGARKQNEKVVVEYQSHQHKTMVYPLLEDPEQVVYLLVKSSRVRHANGSTSNPYELVAVLNEVQAAAWGSDVPSGNRSAHTEMRDAVRMYA